LVPFADDDAEAKTWLAAFQGALNIRIELRWSAADADRMRTFAKELVYLRPDAIFGQTTPAISAPRPTKTATRQIVSLRYGNGR
jgi:hypothetical protein